MSAKTQTLHEQFSKLAEINKCRLINRIESLKDKVEYECLDCRTISSDTTFKLRKKVWCEICANDSNAIGQLKNIILSLKIPYDANWKIDESSDLVYDFFLEKDAGYVIVVGDRPQHVEFAKEECIQLIAINEELFSDPNQLKSSFKRAINTQKPYQILKLKEVEADADGFKRYPHLKISDIDFEKYFWKGINKEKIRKIGLKSKSFIYTNDPPPNKKMKIFRAYCRISTVHQTDGESMNAQYVSAENWAKNKGYLLSVYFDFCISGKNVETRPAIMELRRDIRPGEVLLIANSSRLGRHFSQMTALKDEFINKDVEIITMDDGLSTKSERGIMIGQLKDVMSEDTRKTISENVKRVMGVMSAEGRLKGKSPFGWKTLGGKLIPDEEEQATIVLIKRIREENPLMSLNAMCKKLDDMQIKSRKAKRWYVSTLKHIMSTHKIPITEFDIEAYNEKWAVKERVKELPPKDNDSDQE